MYIENRSNLEEVDCQIKQIDFPKKMTLSKTSNIQSLLRQIDSWGYEEQKKETFVQCNQTCENRFSCEWNSNKFKLHKINKIKWQNIIFLPKAIRYIYKLLLKCSNFKNIFG